MGPRTGKPARGPTVVVGSLPIAPGRRRTAQGRPGSPFTTYSTGPARSTTDGLLRSDRPSIPSVMYSLVVTHAGERRLFHFTHLKHLPDIFAEMRLVADSVMQGRGGVPMECGDRSVKAERRTRQIALPPHGSPDDYVPFYFAPRSPMLYVISRGNVPTYHEGQHPLVYLVTSVADAVATGRPFVYSDGKCAAAITRHFNDLTSMDQMIDWDVIGATYWANTRDDGDRMRRRAAEFLVHEHLPVTAIRELATYDHDVAEQVRGLLDAQGLELTVIVRRQWYY